MEKYRHNSIKNHFGAKSLLLAALCLFLSFTFASCGKEDAQSSDEGTVSENSEKPSSAQSDIPSDENSENTDEKIPKGDMDIVVLGDSIAYGYGLENIERERWSYQLSEMLKSDYENVNTVNYGINGQTGSELADMLENSMPEEIKNCDTVLVSIGGNNILRGLMSLLDDESIKNIDEEYLKTVFYDFLKYSFPKEGEDVSEYAYAVAELNSLFDRVNGIFDSDNYKKILEKASRDLEAELSKIVSEIKKANPKALIYIQTVYNPYKGISLGFKNIDSKIELSKRGDGAVSFLNRVIISQKDVCGYFVADVFEGFDRSEFTLTNPRIDLADKKIILDPHPNKKGHYEIAKIYYSLLTEGRND